MGYINGERLKFILNKLKTFIEIKSNKTTILNSQSTNTQYPGAKTVWDALQGKANSADLNVKQDKLTAGTNITISNNTISAKDTTYSVFKASGASAAQGLVPKPSTTAGTTKYLREDGTWTTPPDTNTVYTAGTNITISDNTISAKDTTYSTFVKSGTNAAEGLVPKPSTTAGTTKYLREDGTWTVPTDTTYKAGTNITISGGTISGNYQPFVKSGSGAAQGLVPKPSTTAGTTKYLREDGTWTVPPNTTYNVFVKSGSDAAQGLVPQPSTTAGTTKYLREDGTWTVPPNTTYSTFVKSGSDAAGGLVPKPSTTAGTTKYLREDGTWTTPTNTKNTAGSTNTSSKIFLIGATSQEANPTTYSHDTAYVGTDGCLYSDGKKVITTVDTALSSTSTNPVQNSVVYNNCVRTSGDQTISGVKIFSDIAIQTDRSFNNPGFVQRKTFTKTDSTKTTVDFGSYLTTGTVNELWNPTGRVCTLEWTYDVGSSTMTKARVLNIGEKFLAPSFSDHQECCLGLIGAPWTNAFIKTLTVLDKGSYQAQIKTVDHLNGNRTIVIQDANGTLPLLETEQTFTKHQSFSEGIWVTKSTANTAALDVYCNNASTNTALRVTGVNYSSSNKNYAIEVPDGTVHIARKLEAGQIIDESADYAELLEWSDGNIYEEDRRGHFVVFDKDNLKSGKDMMIRLFDSSKDSVADIIGIVSANASIICDSDINGWQGKYKRDIFGGIIYKNNKPIISDEYDETKDHVNRIERKEWDCIGFLGKIVMVDDGSCEVGGYAKPTSDNSGRATYSKERTKFKVIKRIDDTHVKVLFS